VSLKAGCIAALIMTLAPAGIAQAADAANGGRIAERWCSGCHVATPGGAGTDAVPALETIARNRQGDAGWMREWLSNPHPPMPNPNLTRTEIDDVVAYLESLNR
jgi:mono/diheme cytochrome c family protein